MRRLRALAGVMVVTTLVFPDMTLEARGAASRVCGGKQATVLGTKGSNKIHGTPKADVIWAGGGNDRIAGGGGNDTICGNGGNDSLRGGRGRDRLIGGSGTDACKGGPGRDKLISCEVTNGTAPLDGPRPGDPARMGKVTLEGTWTEAGWSADVALTIETSGTPIVARETYEAADTLRPAVVRGTMYASLPNWLICDGEFRYFPDWLSSSWSGSANGMIHIRIQWHPKYRDLSESYWQFFDPPGPVTIERTCDGAIERSFGFNFFEFGLSGGPRIHPATDAPPPPPLPVSGDDYLWILPDVWIYDVFHGPLRFRWAFRRAACVGYDTNGDGTSDCAEFELPPDP